MTARIPDDTREAMLACYRRTHSPLSVAEAFGVSRSTAHRVLASFDAARTGAAGASRRLRADGTTAHRRPRGPARGSFRVAAPAGLAACAFCGATGPLVREGSAYACADGHGCEAPREAPDAR